MEIINGQIKLDEDEALLFGSVLQGMLLGFNAKIESGQYVKKEEKELIEMVKMMVNELEEAEII